MLDDGLFCMSTIERHHCSNLRQTRKTPSRAYTFYILYKGRYFLYGADICLMFTVTLLMLFSFKRCPDYSRLFLGIYYLIFTLAEIANSVLSISSHNIADNFIPLMPVYTAVSYVILIISMLYPIEILRPNWFKLKHFVITLIPWFIILVLLYGWQGDKIRVLNSTEDVFTYIYEPNVWLRVLLSMLFLPFAFLSFICQ